MHSWAAARSAAEGCERLWHSVRIVVLEKLVECSDASVAAFANNPVNQGKPRGKRWKVVAPAEQPCGKSTAAVFRR